ncbi:hypothetical protein PRIPAC_88401 [Pristionchus pacificus]|uniref:Uncharacterized protein n=1 Tax=Pristionchus pacificus TaxID=54126 RepID=A0A454XL58_PRIPA|nr:hypothetical protein PRIPAC_88401 [Pristionchus pacificus]|eukprot:PDM82411.1 hypothetical protein PRIPAC_36804 [Pristionchus pacificus]
MQRNNRRAINGRRPPSPSILPLILSTMRFLLFALLLLPAILLARPRIQVPEGVDEVQAVAMAKREAEAAPGKQEGDLFDLGTVRMIPPIAVSKREAGEAPVDKRAAEEDGAFERTEIGGRPFKVYHKRTPKGINVRRFVPDDMAVDKE